MHDTLSLALGFLETDFAKKRETVTERFLAFFGVANVTGASGFARSIPSWYIVPSNILLFNSRSEMGVEAGVGRQVESSGSFGGGVTSLDRASP